MYVSVHINCIIKQCFEKRKFVCWILKRFPFISVLRFSGSVGVVNLAVTRWAHRMGRPRYRIPRSTVSLTQQRAPIRAAIVLSGWEFRPRGSHRRRDAVFKKQIEKNTRWHVIYFIWYQQIWRYHQTANMLIFGTDSDSSRDYDDIRTGDILLYWKISITSTLSPGFLIVLRLLIVFWNSSN